MVFNYWWSNGRNSFAANCVLRVLYDFRVGINDFELCLEYFCLCHLFIVCVILIERPSPSIAKTQTKAGKCYNKLKTIYDLQRSSMGKYLKMLGYLILLFLVISNYININFPNAITILLGVLSAILMCAGIYISDTEKAKKSL